jgi:hypothetical protein
MNILLTESQLNKIINNQQKYSAVLIGGLDNRKDSKGNLIDKTISEQVSLLERSSGLNNIMGFRFNASSNELKTFIEGYPNLSVVMFSKGCERAHEVLSFSGVDPNNVFVIQPWAGNGAGYYNRLSMPKGNIYVGKSSSTGFGIKGATPCPEGMGHWESLPAIGGMVLKKRKSGTTTNTPPPKKGPKAIFMEMNVGEASVYDFNDPSEKAAKYKKKREYKDLKKDDVTNQFIKKIGRFEFYYSINEEEGEFFISVIDSIKKVMVAKAPFIMKFSGTDFEAAAPYVDPEYRNIGIGMEIYKTALDFGNVVSGINKSQYAVGLWRKMYRELTNKMVAVDPETKKEYSVTTDENGDLKIDGNDNIKIYGDRSKVYLKLYQN